MRWIFLLCVACHGSSVTTSTHMVGRMVTHEGEPVAGQRVQTVEAETRTAADGLFDLSYKADAAYIHFIREGVWYRRMVAAEDMGRVVDVVLPSSRSIAMECPKNACPLEFSWALDGGWYAAMEASVSRARCACTRLHRWVHPTCRARGSSLNPSSRFRRRRSLGPWSR